MKLAQEISPNESEEDLVRPPPQWTFPNGDPSDVGDENPWSSWNAAQQKNDEDVSPRDPKAETDFWRSAARDIESSSENPPIEVTSSPASTPFDPPDVIIDSDTNVPISKEGSDGPENVWGMARGVTGEMTSLQNRLRDELDQYDPDENKDQYRNIARELVGPENDEPWDDKDPVRMSDQADAGSGWNPDVDWMRYDDVGREKALANEAAKRRAIENAARETMESALDEEDLDTREADEWNTLTDQRPSDISTTSASTSGQAPGFIANRGRSQGTYGDGWSGSKQEMENLKQQGEELRDPKSDTDSWRSIARELNVETSENVDDASLADAVDQSKLENEAVSVAESDTGSVSQSFESVAESISTSDELDVNLWSQWRSSSSSWEKANEKLEERDPKKEVDMWLGSARELTSESNENEAENIAGTSGTDANTVDATGESSVWEQWRQSNLNWEKSIRENEKDWEQGKSDDSTTNGWSGEEKGKKDWGAGLGKTNSERSAWDSWNRVAGQEPGDDSSMWWRTRFDDLGSTNEGSETIAENVPNTVSGEREERLESDSVVTSWRSLAKELASDEKDEE